MHSLDKLKKGALIFICGSIYTKFLSAGWRIIAARIGVEEYGLFAIGLTIFEMLAALSLFSLDVGILRYVSYYKARNEPEKIEKIIISAIKISLVFSLILASGLYFLSPFLATDIFHNTKLISILRVFALVIPFWSLTTIFLFVTLSFQKVKYYVYTRDFCESSLKLGISILLVYLGFKIWGVLWGFIISQIAAFILSLYFLQKVFPVKSFKSDFTSKLFSYSLPLVFSTIIFIILNWIDVLILCYFKGTYYVGIYNAAIPIASLLLLFPRFFLYLFSSISTEFYAQKKNIKELSHSIDKLIAGINLFIVVFMIIFSKRIIVFLFGKAYEEASLPLIILSFGYLAASLYYTSEWVVKMLKKTFLHFLIVSIAALTNIILNLILIPSLGINGAAIATSLSYSLLLVMFKMFAIRLMKKADLKQEIILEKTQSLHTA